MTDWYVLFGHPERRRWEDAARYGFVSGGGARRWSSRIRGDLRRGDRVFLHVPNHGYVGIGQIIDEAVAVDQFTMGQRRLLDLPLMSPGLTDGMDDPETCEWMARVRWQLGMASPGYWRRGLFYRRSTNVAELPRETAEEIERGLAGSSPV